MAEVPKLFPQSEEDDVFDEFDPDDDIQLLSNADAADAIPYGFTWQFDFNEGDLDFKNGGPKKVYSLDVVNEWIMHTLNTERGEVDTLTDNIGTSIFNLLGDVPDSYVLSRIKSELTRAIGTHDRIEEVTYVSAISIRGQVYVYMSYLTDDSITGQAFVQVR